MTNEGLRGKCIKIINAPRGELRVSFYFVRRTLKEGVVKQARICMLDKYVFSMCRAKLSTDIADFVIEGIKTQIDSTLGNDKIEIKEFQIIDDDLEDGLYVYSAANVNVFKSSVSGILSNTATIPKMNKLSEIKQDVFAYCVGVRVGEDQFYSFRRITPARIVITDVGGVKGAITAAFDSSSGELKPLEKDAIRLDKKVDCIFLENTFFVFQKKGFEDLAGLEDEHRSNAMGFIQDLVDSSIIVLEKDDIVEDVLKVKSLVKIIADVSKKKNHIGLTSSDLSRLSRIERKMSGKTLNIEDGKVRIRTLNDLTIFVKLINDYYKQGTFTQKYYRSNAGRQVTPREG